MPIQNAAHLVGNWFVHVAPLDQDGVDRRDASSGRLARAFEQAGENGERAWRIAAPRRGLARREAHFPLSPGKAGDRVDEQEDPRTVITEMLSVGRGNLRRPQALERGRVTRRNDDHTLLAPFGPQRSLEKLTDLATPFADESDDDDVCIGAAGDRPEERALADARPRE